MSLRLLLYGLFWQRSNARVNVTCTDCHRILWLKVNECEVEAIQEKSDKGEFHCFNCIEIAKGNSVLPVSVIPKRAKKEAAF